MKVKLYRHGDILLKQIESLPSNAKMLKDKVLAYGEVTGHSHRFQEPENIDHYEYEGKKYLLVRVATPLIHEEHLPQIILPGIYEQIQEREYSYEDEDARVVVD